MSNPKTQLPRQNANRAEQPPGKPEKTCGLVMPISSIDGCGADHWLEVREIVEESIGQVQEYAIRTAMVSEADNSPLIHKRIVQSLYSRDIVICDLSAKNPNVMLELGMRLAFDKPAILIIDDRTDFSFDASPIEHLRYPRDLRFSRIVDFKDTLAGKVQTTLQESQKPGYSSFLSSFGPIKVAEIGEEKISGAEALLAKLDEISQQISSARFDRIGGTEAKNPLHESISQSLLRRRMAAAGSGSRDGTTGQNVEGIEMARNIFKASLRAEQLTLDSEGNFSISRAQYRGMIDAVSELTDLSKGLASQILQQLLGEQKIKVS